MATETLEAPTTGAETEELAPKEKGEAEMLARLAKESPLKNTKVAKAIGVTEGAVRAARQNKPAAYLRMLVAYFSEIPYDRFKKLSPAQQRQLLHAVAFDIRELVEGRVAGAKVVSVFNPKGGVGKTTVCAIAELPNAIIYNVDVSQPTEAVNKEGTTIGYGQLRRSDGVATPLEGLELLVESGEHEHILVDMPAGNIIEMEAAGLLDILEVSDLIVVPFTPSERTALATIANINTLLQRIDRDTFRARWGLVANQCLNDEEGKKYLKEIKKFLKDELGEGAVAFTHRIKQSLAVRTLEKKRKTVSELSKENLGAYRNIRHAAGKLTTKMTKALLGMED